MASASELRVGSARGLALLGAATALYLVAVPIARLTVLPDSNVAIFWFPIAIFVGLIARLPYSWIPALAGALAVAEFIGTQVFEGVAFPAALLWVLATVVEAVVVGVALKLVKANSLREPLDLLVFTVTVPIAAILSAAIGGLAITASFGGHWLLAAQHWWLGDTFGILVLAPLVLLVKVPDAVSASRVVEYLAVVAITIAASLWIFLKPASSTDFNLWPALLIPILGWIALSFGVVAAAGVAPVVVLIAAISSVHSVGPFEGTTSSVGQLVPTQIFLIVISLSAYAAGLVAEANKRAEALLHEQAFSDPLTGLANRRAMLARIRTPPDTPASQILTRAALFCDLRGFKQINDTLGHAAGDEALIETATRLKAVIGDGGTVSRFGGDEFVVLLEYGADRAAVEQIIAKIVMSVGGPMEIFGEDQLLGVDIGVAFETADVQRSEQLVIRADVALLEAKREVDASAIFYVEALDRRLRARVDSLALIRNALDRGGIEVWLQSVVDTQTGAIVGAEALARIRSSDGTIHAPAKFIDVAEQSGLIIGLGQTMLEKSLDWLVRDAGDYPNSHIAVNVSIRQLYDRGFVQSVLGALSTRGVDPERLVLEVTERTVLDLQSPAVDVLQALRAEGVKIAIDDFGTGFASFTALRHLPADIVKIDRSFIDGMLDNDEDKAIVSAMIHVAHDLNRTVVAEGVETRGQAQAVAMLGAESIQGFYFSHPVPAADFQFSGHYPSA